MGNSSTLKGACVFAQSGGPTSVINASAAGVIQEALKQECITDVYASAHGIKGMLNGELYDMGKEDARELDLLLNTPSSAFGSARYKLKHYDEDDRDYEQILKLFQKHNVRYMFFNGGNDSMDTCNKVGKYLANVGYECRVMGVPKTIDNDLWGTDHCPGFGSAAKYIATSCMEVSLDAKVYDKGMVIVLEVMGRNAGWLTASTALAGAKGLGPDLIYLPETPFSVDKFLGDVEAEWTKSGNVIAAISEGVHNEDGVYVTEMNYDKVSTDSFGHAQLGGAGAFLGNVIKENLGVKVRVIELSLLQRCAAHCASRTDIEESYLAGKTAVQEAVAGKSGFMVGFKRAPGKGYKCETVLLDVSKVANEEKKVPAEWIANNGAGVTPALVEYALPLIQGDPKMTLEDGLPRFAQLKKIRV